jgi:hypothetical protein
MFWSTYDSSIQVFTTEGNTSFTKEDFSSISFDTSARDASKASTSIIQSEPKIAMKAANPSVYLSKGTNIGNLLRRNSV